MFVQVFRRKMGIPLHHAHTFPSAHFLQCSKRNARLNQPTCPCVAQVMPAEIGNACFFQRILPKPRTDAFHRIAVRVSKNKRRVLAHLFLQYANGCLIQRNTYGPPSLGFVRINPCRSTVQIYLRPLQLQNISLAQSCGQTENRHISQVVRKDGYQFLRVFSR